MQQRLLLRGIWIVFAVAGGFVTVASCSGSEGSALSGPTAGEDGASRADGSDGRASSADGDPTTGTDADAGKCQQRPSAGGKCPSNECYCADPSACFAASIATECCTRQVSCTTKDGGNLDASDCKGSHPLLDASVRYCSPDHCYCAARDACLAEQIATTCCPDAVVVCY